MRSRLLHRFADQLPASPIPYPLAFHKEAQPADHLTRSPVTELLHQRLSSEARSAIAATAGEEQRRVLAEAQPKDRPWVELAIGVSHGLDAVLNQTGLSQAVPPDDVHAMSRGWLGAGGSYGHADLVVDSLREAGVELHDGMTGLDFGCSSGRVIRVLQAAAPGVRWIGCDPNHGAVEWAGGALPGIEFFASPLRPPLPLAASTIDFAYAVSIWSHFAEAPALAWFAEMHRLLKPRGVLIFTTHGRHSVVHYCKTGERSAAQLEEVVVALLQRAFWYHPEFGDAGDHGVVDPEWGTAFMTPEWVLGHLSRAWDVVRFFSGREDDNQDVYILRRRSVG